jgi:hypothetical protein
VLFAASSLYNNIMHPFHASWFGLARLAIQVGSGQFLVVPDSKKKKGKGREGGMKRAVGPRFPWRTLYICCEKKKKSDCTYNTCASSLSVGLAAPPLYVYISSLPQGLWTAQVHDVSCAGQSTLRAQSSGLVLRFAASEGFRW